jgi:hypothetical protein
MATTLTPILILRRTEVPVECTSITGTTGYGTTEIEVVLTAKATMRHNADRVQSRIASWGKLRGWAGRHGEAVTLVISVGRGESQKMGEREREGNWGEIAV